VRWPPAWESVRVEPSQESREELERERERERERVCADRQSVESCRS
jgi:hypothetical protein